MSENSVLFTNVSIIDGSGADPVTGHVLVDEGRIKSISTARAKR